MKKIELTKEESFDKLIKNTPTYVKFYGTTCPLCTVLDNTLEATFGDDESIEIINVNAHEFMDISMQYRVRSLPKLIKITDGGFTTDWKEYTGTPVDVNALREFFNE